MNTTEEPAFGPAPPFVPTGRSRRVIWAVLLVLLSACGGSAVQPTDAPTYDDKVAAAAVFCPLMWDAYRSLSEAFNRVSLTMKDLPAPVDRRARWEKAFLEMEETEQQLAATLEGLDVPVLELAREQVLEGLELSGAEIDDIRLLFVDSPEIDEQRHQARTQQIVVRVEKVIDLIKPEMSVYRDPEMIEAFRTVPACQHAVKDVDDGIGRANG